MTLPAARITVPWAVLGLAVGLLAWPRPVAAWHGWADGPHAWAAPGRVPAPIIFFFPAALPVPGYRLFHPPGLPLSYAEPATGTTYCLSQATGYYFACGYAPAAGGVGEPPAAPRPGVHPAADLEAASVPSAVFLFRLPADAEASVDGEAVGLSGGVGAAAVAPGRHRVRVRSGGRETDQVVAVASRAILTVTPAGISPADP